MHICRVKAGKKFTGYLQIGHTTLHKRAWVGRVWIKFVALFLGLQNKWIYPWLIFHVKYHFSNGHYRPPKNAACPWLPLDINERGSLVPDWESTKPRLCSKFPLFKKTWWMLRVLQHFALLNHLYHTWELSNEVLYDLIHQEVSKVHQVKVETSTFIK